MPQTFPLRPAPEVERELGLPDGFLRSRRHGSSTPPFYRVGARTVLYDPDAVRSWLQSCACDGGTPRRQAVGG